MAVSIALCGSEWRRRCFSSLCGTSDSEGVKGDGLLLHCVMNLHKDTAGRTNLDFLNFLSMSKFLFESEQPGDLFYWSVHSAFSFQSLFFSVFVGSDELKVPSEEARWLENTRKQTGGSECCNVPVYILR